VDARIIEFAEVLRQNGVRVSTSEVQDALLATTEVGLKDRLSLTANSASVLGVGSSLVGVELTQRARGWGGERALHLGRRAHGLRQAGVRGAEVRRVPGGPSARGGSRDGEVDDRPGRAPGVYVAYDPASLARDAAGLVEAGYKPLALQVVDMLPQTHHVEADMSFEVNSEREGINEPR